MRYKAVVFDFDLTLADSSGAIIQCYKHTLSHFGYPPRSDKEIFDTIGKTLMDSFDILTGIKDNPEREEMRRVYVAKADEVMAADTVFYTDTLPLLDSLRDMGVKTGIVSSKMKYRIEETFMLHFGRIPVDEIIGLHDMPAPKPEPDGLLIAAERLGAETGDVLYVGDSFIDAETARNAGTDFAAVTTGSTSDSEFEDYPHICICGSLGELRKHFENIG